MPFGRKQMYLSTIKDLNNGEIIAYSLGDCQDTNFVLDTLNQLPELPQDVPYIVIKGPFYTSFDNQQSV